MAGVKYVQVRGMNKVVHAAPPTNFNRKDGGKFDFREELSQQDLEYLYEHVGIVDMITRVEIPDSPKKAEDKKKPGSDKKKD